MNKVTIHTYSKSWEGAQVTGVGTDTFTADDDVLIVGHPEFNGDMDFYAEPDEEGRHLNVGNSAFWVTDNEADSEDEEEEDAI